VSRAKRKNGEPPEIQIAIVRAVGREQAEQLARQIHSLGLCVQEVVEPGRIGKVRVQVPVS
jgi:hypothetical protein